MSQVWVVYVPLDYDDAEIVGVFNSEEQAKREAANKKSEVRSTANVRICKSWVQSR